MSTMDHEGPATELAYYLDSAVEGTATVVSLTEEAGFCHVVLDRTLFHPGGGGQKSDIGLIGRSVMLRAERREAEVLHRLEGAPDFGVGDVVPLVVDGATRRRHSRWHTAGHLLGSVMEEVLRCTAVSGQHWVGDAFMRFDLSALPSEAELDRCRAKWSEIIGENRPVTAEVHGRTRLVTIQGFRPVPCGGTHVAGTAELGAIEIASVKVKKDRLFVAYQLDISGNS